APTGDTCASDARRRRCLCTMRRRRSLSLLLFGRGICRYLLLLRWTFISSLVCSNFQRERPSSDDAHLPARGLRSPSRRTTQSPPRSTRSSPATLTETFRELCRKLFQIGRAHV